MTRRRAPAASCDVALPADFRPGDMLAFHARDIMAIAEQVDGRNLIKGITWCGRAARLAIRFDQRQARATLDVDGGPGADPAALEAMVRRMLGLTQPVADFEAAHRRHALVGPLIAARPGLRVPVSATPFEALTWAITGQQISLTVAITLRRRLIELAGPRHATGIACYPAAAAIAAVAEADLRRAGFSGSKAHTLLALSGAVVDGELPLDEWAAQPPVDEIRRRLLGLRGIGPWTADYALLRGFGWVDGSLHGDAAVRRKLRLLLGATDKLDETFTQQWLAPFSPWRALVAAHLWAMPADPA
jgi:DNA-3-methyladenine glycosylase II